ncbi:MAG: hypothetical protein C4547_09125 [Phycisphaerales bacterium]|nr:MAG: hypothetical protein C4547_09125 [Phycisphaerales bacterium]
MFINKLMRALKPNWVRPEGSNVVRILPCGNRAGVIKRTPTELKNCLNAGGHTTLMVWADCDHDCADGNALRELFWQEAQRQEITKAQFDRVVFLFAKDRIENWIEFLTTGNTDESNEGRRVKHNREAAEAAKKLASMCSKGKPVKNMPPSLDWSCKNWRALVGRMGTS